MYIDGPVEYMCADCSKKVLKWEDFKTKREMFYKKLRGIEKVKVWNKGDIGENLEYLARHLEDMEYSITWIKSCMANINEKNKQLRKTRATRSI